MDIGKSYNINLIILFECINSIQLNHITGCKDTFIIKLT